MTDPSNRAPPSDSPLNGSRLARRTWHIDHRRRLCQPMWTREEIETIERLAEVQDVPTETIVKLAVLNADAASIHTCHDPCQNPTCVQRRRIAELETAIRETLTRNAHLADGDDCTLKELKRVL